MNYMPGKDTLNKLPRSYGNENLEEKARKIDKKLFRDLVKVYSDFRDKFSEDGVGKIINDFFKKREIVNRIIDNYINFIQCLKQNIDIYGQYIEKNGENKKNIEIFLNRMISLYDKLKLEMKDPFEENSENQNSESQNLEKEYIDKEIVIPMEKKLYESVVEFLKLLKKKLGNYFEKGEFIQFGNYKIDSLEKLQELIKELDEMENKTLGNVIDRFGIKSSEDIVRFLESSFKEYTEKDFKNVIRFGNYKIDSLEKLQELIKELNEMEDKTLGNVIDRFGIKSSEDIVGFLISSFEKYTEKDFEGGKFIQFGNCKIDSLEELQELIKELDEMENKTLGGVVNKFFEKDSIKYTTSNEFRGSMGDIGKYIKNNIKLDSMVLGEDTDKFFNTLVSFYNEIRGVIKTSGLGEGGGYNQEIDKLNRVSNIKLDEKELYKSIVNFLILLFKKYEDEKYFSGNNKKRQGGNRVIKFGDYEIDSEIELKCLIEKLNKMKDEEPSEIKLTELEMILLKCKYLVKSGIFGIFSKKKVGEEVKNDEIENNQLEKFGISKSCNPEMYELVKNLQKKFGSNIKVVQVGPAPKSQEKKTDVILKLGNNYIKAFTKEGRVLGETEYGGIKSFNSFCTENDSSFSGPEIVEEGETEDGGFYFMMKNAGEIVNFSKEEIKKIKKFYDKYRQTFDKFEEDSKGKTTTESNPKIQLLYSLYKRYLQPEVSSESTKKSSKIINGAKTALCNVLQPAFKLVIGKKYKSKVNQRILNGKEVVEKCDIDIDREKINKTLDKLLSKVKRFDFEYNFGRLWTNHVFSDVENYRFIDFDNVSYQIKGTELIGLMWDNLLISTGNYDSYGVWKFKYDEWYGELLEMYKDENLVKLLLFVKLIGTIFEDYGNLICNRKTGGEKEGQENESIEKIRKGVKWNWNVLQELMDNVG